MGEKVRGGEGRRGARKALKGKRAGGEAQILSLKDSPARSPPPPRLTCPSSSPSTACASPSCPPPSHPSTPPTNSASATMRMAAFPSTTSLSNPLLPASSQTALNTFPPFSLPSVHPLSYPLPGLTCPSSSPSTACPSAPSPPPSLPPTPPTISASAAMRFAAFPSTTTGKSPTAPCFFILFTPPPSFPSLAPPSPAPLPASLDAAAATAAVMFA
ncbi:unnamed protein product [Closterium sp. NIES-65]|nr:unnamed protein product [Closterium sp. NIES-65]